MTTADASAPAKPTPLAKLGARLADAGLTERGVLACFGAPTLAHVPAAIARCPDPGPSPPPASVAAWLFVAGHSLPIAAVRARLGGDVEALAGLGLVKITSGDGGERVRATRALIPIGPSISVCDRLDTPTSTADAVLWPDDSSFHLIGALPRGRIGRWLDIGTGSALAPLATRGRAATVRATDINSRAIAAAALGVGLSGAAFDLAVADLGDGAVPAWDLITFNAPIPAEANLDPEGTTGHRRAPAGAAVLERFWRQAPLLVADGGEVVVHSILEADPLAALDALPGRLTVIRYTPIDHPAFGITCWRPGAERDRRVIDLALTAEHPHIGRDDLGSAEP